MLTAERLPGSALELTPVDAEDLNAGLDGVFARDGGEDVLPVGRPDGLGGVAAGVEGVGVKDLCGRECGTGQCGCEEQGAHGATISCGGCSVSDGVTNFSTEDVGRMLAPMAQETSNATEFNTPGHLPSPDRLVNVPRLVTAFYAQHPDVANPSERVSFGTSGHRGSSLQTSFNYAHILAITQAICQYRAKEKTTGPLFLAQDTHALSDPAFATALEVLSANGVHVMIDKDLGYTPTPALSHAILKHNREVKDRRADGIVITPSHNPPEDGGFKYNPPTGGPADTTATKWIENRANELIGAKLEGVKRLAYHRAVSAETTQKYDFISSYVDDLPNIIDIDAIRTAG